MKARDIMTPNVITVGPTTPVADIAKLLLERHISAVPVVDEKGRVLGIVSEGDLMRRPETGTERHASWWLSMWLDHETLAQRYTKSHGLDAQAVMTHPAVTVSEDTSLADVAEILERKRIKRVPVVRGDQLVGIISRANIIQRLAVSKDKVGAEIDHNDSRIRRELLDILQREPWVSTTTINIVVDSGIVYFYGVIASEAERKALAVAARNVKGVRAVEDHLHVRGELKGHYEPYHWSRM